MSTAATPTVPDPVTTIRPAAPVVAARHFYGRLAFETDASDVAAALAAGSTAITVIDTRPPEAFAVGHVPGAINLPHARITTETTATLDPQRIQVTYCWGPSCNAATKGAARLADLGFRVKEMLGGIDAWEREGFALAT